MNTLPELEYEISASGSVYVEAVGSPEVQLFCARFDDLKTLIRLDELGEPWISLRASLGRIRWRLLTWPLPVQSDPIGLTRSLEEIRGLASAIGEHDANRPVLDRCIDSLDDLRSLTYTNPLGERVLEIVETGEPGLRGIVVLSQDSVAPTAEWIRQFLPDVRVWPSSVGNSIPIRQLLVLVGRPERFCRKGVETTPFVTAPRAESTCFVQFDFLGSPQQIPGLLTTNSPGVSRKFLGGFEAPVAIADEVEVAEFDEIDGTRFERRAVRAHAHLGDEKIVARVVRFADESFTFISDSEESTVQIAISDQNGRIGLRSKQSTDVAVGDVLVLRTGGSDSAHIRDLADANFGAAGHRSRITEWKSIVRAKIQMEGGVTAARRKVSTGDLQVRNLDYWITPDAIRPRYFEHFEAVSKFADVPEDEYLEIWDSMSAVFSAHQEAGQFIRERLEEGLEGRTLESIEDSLFVEVEIDGFGTLRAARVAQISDQSFEVPPRSIHEVFLDDEEI